VAKSHSFWVIIDGAVPTAFRAKNREDLLPTLTQLKRTQPNVVLMWFERGRVWESPTAARAALEARRSQPRPRDRKPEWRPGGDHRDPRAKYQSSRDEKRARFKKRRDFERRSDPPGGSRPDWGNRPSGGDRPPRRDSAGGFDRPSSRPRQYSDSVDRRPRGPGSGRPSGVGRPRGPEGARPARGSRPPGTGGSSWRPKPSRAKSGGASSGRPKGPWKPKPDRGGAKPPRRRRDEE